MVVVVVQQSRLMQETFSPRAMHDSVRSLSDGLFGEPNFGSRCCCLAISLCQHQRPAKGVLSKSVLNSLTCVCVVFVSNFSNFHHYREGGDFVQDTLNGIRLEEKSIIKDNCQIEGHAIQFLKPELFKGN